MTVTVSRMWARTAKLAVSCCAVLIGCGGSDARPALELPPEGRWFGFSTNTFQYTGRGDPQLNQGITAARAVRDARAAGVNSARTQVSWWDLEPERGRVDRRYAAVLRRFIRGVEAAGGRVVAVLGVPPPWASARPGDAHAAPLAERVGDYAAYARRVAELFPSLLAIETWNEPNATFFWTPGRPDPKLYARMHRAAAAAIRDVSPRIRVLVGGFVGVVDDNAEVVAPARFMRAMGLGRRDYDGLAVHLYPGEQNGRMKDLDGDLAGALEEAREAAPDGVKLWITETGVTSSGPAGLSGAAQGAGLVELLRRLLSEPDVAGAWVHTQYELVSAPDGDPERGYGVLRARPGRAPAVKPAYCELARHARRRVSACR